MDVFPNDQLAGGNAAKGIEMISDGSVDMAAYATSVLSALDERVSIGTIPWLFDSPPRRGEVIDSTGLAYYDSALERLDLKVIGSFHNGFRQLTNNKHAVTGAGGPQGPEHPRSGSEIYMSFSEPSAPLPARPTGARFLRTSSRESSTARRTA